MKRVSLLAAALCLAFSSRAFAYTLDSREWGRSGYDLEVDPYYSSIGFYTGLLKEPRPHLGENDETEIYRHLLRRAFLPTCLLVEASAYPLPWIGTGIKKNMRATFDRSQLGERLNLVTFVTEGFQEPYAASVFIGNLVSFKPKGVTADVNGKAYMGYLFSAGDFHIKDCDLVEDSWFEAEWKIKGDRITDIRKMKWSYRVGTKQHGNPFIKDVIYFSVSRDRVDLDTGGAPSFFNNSGAEYRVDYDWKNSEVVRHFFLVGKSFPSKSKKYAFQLNVGVIWEKDSVYTGDLRRPDGKDYVDYMFRPNIVF